MIVCVHKGDPFGQSWFTVADASYEQITGVVGISLLVHLRSPLALWLGMRYVFFSKWPWDSDRKHTERTILTCEESCYVTTTFPAPQLPMISGYFPVSNKLNSLTGVCHENNTFAVCCWQVLPLGPGFLQFCCQTVQSGESWHLRVTQK